MPTYATKTPYRKKTYRKKPYKKYGKPLTVRVKKLERANATRETKYSQTLVTAQTVSWSALFSDLTSISQGSSATTRVGDRIFLKGIKLNLEYTQGAVPCDMRVLIVCDKANNITAANQVLTTTGTVVAPCSQYNMDYRTRYIVKFDRRFTLTPVSYNSGGFSVYIPVNKVITYEAGGVNERTNNMRLIAISDIDPATPANLPSIQWTTTSYFYDD